MRRYRGILFCAFTIMLMLSLAGCGVKVSTKSPEGVTKSIIQAYQKGDEDAVKKCFGIDSKKKVPEEVNQEMKYNLNTFKAHDADKVKFQKCASLGSFNGYDLVYAIYVLKKEEKSEKLEVPSLSMYFAQKKDKEYHIVPAKDVTEDMSQISSEEFAKFMKTDEYKAYEKDYKKFVRTNPDYETNLAKKMEKISE